MRTIKAIELVNFGPFRGSQVIRLKAQPYAVTAQWTHDAERSNYGGKSMLLEAIPFTITGWLNPDRNYRSLDDFITEGESVGGVKLTFDDDSWVSRMKLRGKPMVLTGCVGGLAVTREGADDAIAKLVGLSKVDFFATCFFRQRDIAKLVLANSGELTEIVSGWFQLGPLEEAEGFVGIAADTLESNAAPLRDRVKLLQAIEAEALPEGLGGKRPTLKQLTAEHFGAKEHLESANGALTLARTRLTENARLLGAQGAIARYEAIVEDGKRLKKEIESRDSAKLEAAVTKAKAAEQSARDTLMLRERDAKNRLTLVKQGFDGTCPVAQIECPAKELVNKEISKNLHFANNAEGDAETARAAYSGACDALRSADAKWQELSRLNDRREMLIDQLKKLHPAYALAKNSGEPKDEETLQSEVREKQGRVNALVDRCDALSRRIQDVTRVRAEQEKINEVLSGLEAQLQLHREARLVLRGARREVAEGALAQIEGEANALLARGDIDLSVTLQWARDGKDPARTCETCGQSFPKSVKVVTCERCGAARGRAIISQLEPVLSDRSGAAEDLVGIALQLAASRWLRTDRQAPWGVACLDEPSGQLDVAHRRMFAVGLAQMLSHCGFMQAFITSHTGEVLGALPGRILITASKDGSKVEVIA